jgi:cell division protease FtsH
MRNATTDKAEAPVVPTLLVRLQTHFGADPARLPVLTQEFAQYERPNLHLAVEELMAEPARHSELLGVLVPDDYYGVTLSKLSRPMTACQFDEGPVEYRDVALAGDQQLACVRRGLYLCHDRGQPVALLVAPKMHAHLGEIEAQVMAVDRERAELLLRQLTRRVRYGQAYRGRVLSLETDCYGRMSVNFHELPAIARGDIILPEALLARIERHTLSFSRHAERLRAARRHIKRGILLHGPPGTGKTLTAMYLAAQMQGRTVLLITGHGMGSIETACKLARMLEPATVILEDVDLIGTEREHQTVGANTLLFELLNQMDGLADDADLLFILTTNRPDILEPALAARPGRIDQALEVPLPDADGRRRLLELYGRGLTLEVSVWDNVVERTAGTSGAFIRELLRKAAVLAVLDADEAPLVVRDRHLEEALAELLIAGGPLTQSLLGAAGQTRK